MSVRASPVVLLLLLPAGAWAGGATAEACRTPWSMHPGEGTVGFPDQMASHGQLEEYDYASIPDPAGPGWVAAPDPQRIDYDLANQSTLCDVHECRWGAEFTYFKTLVYLPPGTAYTAAWVDVDVVDDGVRMTVFSSDHPAGITNPGGYAYLGGGVSADLLPEMGGSDWSTVVLTHVDDCCSQSFLRGVEFVVYVDGREVPVPIACDPVDADGDGFPPAGGDCAEGDPSIHPGVPEVADGVDQDCDGVIDETTDRFDDDGDGFSEDDGDCDDTTSAIGPAAEEACDQPDIDYDCDGCPGSTDVDCGGACGAPTDDDDAGDDDVADDDAGDDDDTADDDTADDDDAGDDDSGAAPTGDGCGCFSQRLPQAAIPLLLVWPLRRWRRRRGV